MGEGQIPVVRDQELAAIEKVFEQAGMKEVKFAFIIVSKRIKTKFFRDKENPHSGTIVDDVVTLNERSVVSIVPKLVMFFSRYDFFLVSQSVRQGTVNPTNYNVIRETTGRETLLSSHVQTWRGELLVQLTQGGKKMPVGQTKELIEILRKEVSK